MTIPEVKVHWIGENVYFGVLLLLPREDLGFNTGYHDSGVRAWLWQVYDSAGRICGYGRVATRETAVGSIRRKAHSLAKADGY